MNTTNRMEKIATVAEFKRGPFGSAVKKSICISKGSNTYKLYEQGNVINNDFGRGHYYLTEETFKKLSQFEISEGDLLLTCAGTLGKIAIVPKKFEKGIFNSVLMRIRINENKIIRKYMYYYFQSPKIQNNINKQSAGVAIKNLFSTRLLKDYALYLPDKNEQQLIVEAIETQLTRLCAAIGSLRALKARISVYRKSVLKAAFEKKKDWLENPLDIISEVIGGFAFDSSLMKEKGKYQIIRIGNVKMGKLVLDNKPVCIDCVDSSVRSTYLLKKEDVLMTLTGTRGKRDYGFVAKVNEEDNLLVNQRVARVRPNIDINASYLLWFLSSNYVQKDLFNEETGIVGQGNLKMGKIRNTIIRYPRSVSVQERIVEGIESRFSVIDKIEVVIDASLAKTETLRKSMLKSAFEGRLVN